MAIYSASFVEAGSDGQRKFVEICRSIAAANASWLAASPTNLAIEHTVGISESARWISIRNAVENDLLRRISVDDTTAISIYACDEIAERIQLPWHPLRDTFPQALQTEVIPGSPTRWKELHRRSRKPWWRLW